jgi:hypothetical protein
MSKGQNVLDLYPSAGANNDKMPAGQIKWSGNRPHTGDLA